MHKKIIMACMAIAAFAAFVVAPAASASPVLTNGGSSVPAGTSVTGINTGATFFKGFGGALTVECSTAILHGTVTANTGTTIAGEVAVGQATFGGTGGADPTAPGGEPECTSNIGDTTVTVNSKLCFDTVKATDNVSIDGCGNPITFTLNVTSSGSCVYSQNSITGTFKTNATATVNLAGVEAAKEAGPFFCPGNGTLTMDFDLYTAGGAALLSVS
ncbi:MAG TPA: hypothetical protein VNN15_06660 [Solirubrobacterales bacterium]|nr:hypothetical protein [Solirubrobacterales bacterium]